MNFVGWQGWVQFSPQQPPQQGGEIPGSPVSPSNTQGDRSLFSLPGEDESPGSHTAFPDTMLVEADGRRRISSQTFADG